MLVEALISSILGAFMCSLLGYYVTRIGLSTLTFTIAHSALAGAAIALLLGMDITYIAILFSIVTAVILGLLYRRLYHAMNTVCMTLFSFFNAIALLSLYYSNTTVLATASISAVLWGNVLAVTRDKLVILAGLVTVFFIYVAAYKKHIDALLFDKKLAEAEGINTCFHTVMLLIIASASISIMLRIVGGFLVFALLYIPSALVTALDMNTKRQYIAIPLFATVSTAIGLWISFSLDLPVGVAITLTTLSSATLVAVTNHILSLLPNRFKTTDSISKST